MQPPRCPRALLAISLLATALPALADGPGLHRNSLDDPSWVAKQAAETRPWTREEMMAAIPMPMPEVTEAQLLALAEEIAMGKAYDLTGGPGAFPGGLPEGVRDSKQIASDGADDIAFGALPADEVETMGGTKGYSYPAPFTRYETFTYTAFPHVAIGKVFFRKGAQSFVCSGASIGGDGVITAGHCVQDGTTGNFHTNWIFAPGYKNGASPKGKWSANQLWAHGSWHNGNGGNFAKDIGGAVLNRRGGKRLSQVAGFLGFAYNQNNNNAGAHFTAVGYPAASPFNGKKQQICQAGFAYTVAGTGSPAPFGIGCDLTGGSSGGPWIRKYGPGAGASNYLVGVNSFKRCFNQSCTSLYTEMNSPYLDTTAKKLYDCVRNSVPGNPANPNQQCKAGT